MKLVSCQVRDECVCDVETISSIVPSSIFYSETYAESPVDLWINVVQILNVVYTLLQAQNWEEAVR